MGRGTNLSNDKNGRRRFKYVEEVEYLIKYPKSVDIRNQASTKVSADVWGANFNCGKKNMGTGYNALGRLTEENLTVNTNADMIKSVARRRREEIVRGM